MNLRRVVITGIGLVTPIGTGWRSFWEAALAGKSGVRAITDFDTSGLSSRIAGQVTDFDPTHWICPHKLKYMSRPVQLAVAAARLAIEDSHLSIAETDCEKIAVFLGCSSNAMMVIEEQFGNLRSKGSESVSPIGVALSYPGAAASNIGVEIGLCGESFTISTGCSSSTNAIGLALRSVRYGHCDLAIAGGVDTPVTPLLMSGFANAQYLSKRNETPTKASRPFDRYRDGYVLSEGAGILILEEYTAALERDAPVYAELAGYGCSCDAYSVLRVEPNGEMAARAIRRALSDAGLTESDIDYLNAHGSSSVVSDSRETKVIKKVFNAHASNLQVSSIKSMIGQPLGASGVIQTAACAISIKTGSIPPTINYEEKDPECDLDYVPNEAREARVRAAVSNCLGMGGNNACLVLKECDH